MRISTMTATERLPLTRLGKTLAGIQFFLGAGALAGTIATHGSVALAVITLVWLASATVTLLGYRWAPIFGAVLSGGSLLYSLFGNPYPQYHLSHPKDPLFAPILLAVVLTSIVCAAMVAAIAQNYGQGRAIPRWFGFAVTALIGFALGGIVIGAASPAPVTGTASANSDGAPIIHLGFNTFTPSAISIPVGTKLDIVDDSNIPHSLTYGQWNGNQTQVATPANAPALGTRQISSGSFEIGPFTKPGVYHILCVIHPGMEMTVTVTGT